MLPNDNDTQDTIPDTITGPLPVTALLQSSGWRNSVCTNASLSMVFAFADYPSVVAFDSTPMFPAKSPRLPPNNCFCLSN